MNSNSDVIAFSCSTVIVLQVGFFGIFICLYHYNSNVPYTEYLKKKNIEN